MDVGIIIIGSMIMVTVLVVLVATNRMMMLKAISDIQRRHDEVSASSKSEIKTDVKDMLEHNRQMMDRIVEGVKEHLKASQQEMKGVYGQSIAIKEQLAQTNKLTENLQASTEGLRSLLANNRLRGAWGEQVAEDLLMGAGFVQDVNYLKQKSTTAGRPDFTILLPDGARLNVDAKFPFDDLIAYQDAKNEQAKRTALKNFETAVKNKVKEVTSKDYINPEDNTLDFVVIFIPNEMIFSFIYEKLPAINDYCNKRKVVLAGPFGFTALLRMVLQAYKNFHYEQGLQQILGQIAQFKTEYEKFGDKMDSLGRQLDTVRKTYDEVEGTRHRALTRIVDKISEQSHDSRLKPSEEDVIRIDKPTSSE